MTSSTLPRSMSVTEMGSLSHDKCRGCGESATFFSSKDVFECENSIGSLSLESCGESLDAQSSCCESSFFLEDDGNSDVFFHKYTSGSEGRDFSSGIGEEGEEEEEDIWTECMNKTLREGNDENNAKSEEDRAGLEIYLGILRSPRCFNAKDDKRSIRNWKQKHQDARLASYMTSVSRQDHHTMLQMLVSHAYFRDKRRRENRDKWCRVLTEIRKRFYGAAALLRTSADPYTEVLGSLSQMCIWNDDERRWDTTAMSEMAQRQASKLMLLRQSGKLFLDDIN